MSDWTKQDLKKDVAVAEGRCPHCLVNRARPDRLLCAPCVRKVNERLAAKRRAAGVKPRAMRCAICREPGHDRRTHDLHVTSRT